MSKSITTERCFSCGSEVPETDGPTHDYMLSSPGCWQVYGEVLAREYQDTAYAANHRLTVDAYAVQHPGKPTPASIRSVNLHLTSLCLVQEYDVLQHRATRALQEIAARAPDFEWLKPPEDLGEVTVEDVYAADDPVSHLNAVERWGRSSWESWSPHHDAIRHHVGHLVSYID